MKRKRVMALCLALGMAVSVFAGCGPKPGDDTKPGTDASVPEGSKAEIKTLASAAEVFPITEETFTLNVMGLQGNFIEDIKTNEFTLEYEDKSNVHVEWEVVPQKSRPERLNLVLATQEGMPDVFYAMGISNEQAISYGMDQGILVDMAPYIEQFAPNIKAVLDSDPVIRNSVTAPDGGIYTLPKLAGSYHMTAPQKAWIYKPWLDKLGLEVPTTTAELEAVLTAFKEKDPNGNGKRDEIPMTGALGGQGACPVDYLMNAFIYTTEDNRWIVDDQGNVSVPYNTPEWREGLKYMNGLYQKGLLDGQAFTQDRNQLKQLCMFEEVPLVGVVSSAVLTTFMNRGFSRFNDFIPLPPLKGPNGAQTTGTRPLTIVAGQAAVSTACKDPAVAVRWLDYLYSFEGAARCAMGVKGRDWRDAEPGEIGINGEPGTYVKLTKFGKTQNFCWAAHIGQCYLPPEWMNGVVMEEGGDNMEQILYDATKNLYEPCKVKNIMWPLFMTAEEASEISEYLYLITDPKSGYVPEAYSKFIIGEMDINDDAQWQSYLDTLEADGLSRLIEVYDANYKAQYMR